jgi:hypothetical protein
MKKLKVSFKNISKWHGYVENLWNFQNKTKKPSMSLERF